MRLWPCPTTTGTAIIWMASPLVAMLQRSFRRTNSTWRCCHARRSGIHAPQSKTSAATNTPRAASHCCVMYTVLTMRPLSISWARRNPASEQSCSSAPAGFSSAR